ncbi:MAG: hypothetical protein J6W60_01765 [Treponema sp.]|nr:hypothetical protein [Treponema sp.]MBP5751572.1 hypothetical protein [Treponema sp.]MBR4387089.1 hypothetical protein [Treponema sp.]
MQLKVNGENVDITLEGEKTVGEILKSFEAEASKNEATTTNIILNGKEIGADEFEKILGEPILDDTSIDLTVVSKTALVRNFKESGKKLEEMQARLGTVSTLLQSGKDAQVGTIITELADQISNFLHIARLSSLFPEFYKELQAGGKDIGQFLEDFMPFLKDFEEALGSKDTVTVGDIAEYEISPRLKQMAEAVAGLKE